jgi:hypothetical protein
MTAATTDSAQRQVIAGFELRLPVSRNLGNSVPRCVCAGRATTSALRLENPQSACARVHFLSPNLRRWSRSDGTRHSDPRVAPQPGRRGVPHFLLPALRQRPAAYRLERQLKECCPKLHPRRVVPFATQSCSPAGYREMGAAHRREGGTVFRAKDENQVGQL